MTTERKAAAVGPLHDAFAAKLHRLLRTKNMSASDLARAMWGTQTDNRGYLVAKNRDRVSAYLRGTSLPDAENRAKLAEVLGVQVVDLFPAGAPSAAERDRPALAIHATAGHPGIVQLTVNQLVPMSIATQVMQLLAAATPAMAPSGPPEPLTLSSTKQTARPSLSVVDPEGAGK